MANLSIMMANLSIMFEVDKYILIGQLITYDALRDLVPFLQFKKRKKKQKKKQNQQLY